MFQIRNIFLLFPSGSMQFYCTAQLVEGEIIEIPAIVVEVLASAD